MDHVYQNILGWFDYHDLYSMMVKKAPDKSHFVEVGGFVGKSATYMAVEIINSGKDIQFDVVENGSFEIKDEWPWAGSKDIKEHFLQNMKKYNLQDYVDLVYMNSIQASNYYLNESLDFVFIDADHDYQSVMNDIVNWLPKVKKGGYIAGHDYKKENFDGVVEAVDKIFGENNIKLMGSKYNPSWLFKVDQSHSL